MISIILPIRNEAHSIRKSIEAILAQDYPQDDIEILVADGMSTDNTREIIKAYHQVYPQIHLIDNTGLIVPTGMNIALRYATGDIIIRVDGHTQIAVDYVRQCVATLQVSGADNAGGKMMAIGATPFGEVVAAATSTPFGIGNSRFHYSDREEYVDSVYMGAWPRTVFDRIGYFDEELVRDQDDEFNYRLREHGGKIILSPKIQSIYTVRGTAIKLWKQYFQYGFWKVRVLQKHPRQMSLRHFVPPTYVTTLLFSAALGLFHPIGLYLLALVAGSYLLANLAASLSTASKRGWKHLPLLPFVFGILHLSYGSGFLVGLVKFTNRMGDKTGKAPSVKNLPKHFCDLDR